MRFPWLHEREESLLRRVGLLPLDVLSVGYGLGARVHRAAYRLGWREPTELECRVISVGNLVVGGSGKTPTAAWIAGKLHSRGHKVAIASRGYGRKGQEEVLVVSDGSDGQESLQDPEQAGDEPVLLARRVQGVPVLVGADRGEVGKYAVSEFGTEVLVLDDGFQHHRLRRDLDIVTVDGALGLGNARVLPRGPLREPLHALQLTDAIAVVDGPLEEGDAARIREAAPAARCFEARRRPTQLLALQKGERALPSTLSSLRVGMLAGLANPGSFRRTLEALGADIVNERLFPDHHPYLEKDLEGLAKQASVWVTTEKDAVKIRPEWLGELDLRVLSIDLSFEEPESFLEWIEGRIQS